MTNYRVDFAGWIPCLSGKIFWQPPHITRSFVSNESLPNILLCKSYVHEAEEGAQRISLFFAFQQIPFYKKIIFYVFPKIPYMDFSDKWIKYYLGENDPIFFVYSEAKIEKTGIIISRGILRLNCDTGNKNSVKFLRNQFRRILFDTIKSMYHLHVHHSEKNIGSCISPVPWKHKTTIKNVAVAIAEQYIERIERVHLIIARSFSDFDAKRKNKIKIGIESLHGYRGELSYGMAFVASHSKILPHNNYMERLQIGSESLRIKYEFKSEIQDCKYNRSSLLLSSVAIVVSVCAIMLPICSKIKNINTAIFLYLLIIVLIVYCFHHYSRWGNKSS